MKYLECEEDSEEQEDHDGEEDEAGGWSQVRGSKFSCLYIELLFK